MNVVESRSAAMLAQHYCDLGGVEDDFRNRNLYSLLAAHIAGNAVLDIGCGSCVFLSDYVKAPRKVGVEPNKILQSLCRQRAHDVALYNISAQQLHKLRESFDTVTLIDVLEHIENDEAELREVYKIIVPGGRLIIAVPALQYLYGKRDQVVGHFRRYEKKELIRKIRDAGFEPRYTRFWNVLGLLPYFVSERILHKPLHVSLRKQSDSTLRRILSGVLDFWFRQVENNCNFHIGLSLIVIAQKPSSDVR